MSAHLAGLDARLASGHDRWVGGDSEHPRNRLRVGVTAPIASLDPQDSLDFACLMVQQQLFEKPYTLDPEGGEPSPVLMAGPLRPIRCDDTCFLARPREGVEFSDGTKLAAHHVVRSLQRSPVVADGRQIRVEGDDVVFDLSTPDPAFAFALTKPWCAIAVQRPDTGAWLGTGPYAVAPGSSPDCVLLTRNPRFRGKAAAIEEIEIRSYPQTPSGSALKLAVAEGRVDFTTALSRDEAADLHDVRKIYQPGSGTAFLWLDCERISDVRVRRALAMAIDRYALAERSYSNPGAFVARSPLPPRMAAFNDGVRHDPFAAREALEQAEVKKPFRLRVLVIWGPRAYMPHPLDWARRLAEQLGEIGVTLEIQQSEDSLDYQRRIRSGEHDMVLGGWSADTDDTYDFVEALFAEVMIPRLDQKVATGCNFARWRDSEVLRALERYRLDRAESSLRAILTRVAAEVPLVPIAHGPTVVVCTPRLRNVEIDALGMPNFADVELDP